LSVIPQDDTVFSAQGYRVLIKSSIGEEKMSEIEKLIIAAERLCRNLEQAALNERKFAHAMCAELERYSWKMHRMSNDIRQLQETFGG
jgi:hypothetical protein